MESEDKNLAHLHFISTNSKQVRVSAVKLLNQVKLNSEVNYKQIIHKHLSVTIELNILQKM